jgi:acyl-CoA reductase-like NAD-dependent aldehyde dehydrogenase
MNKHLRLIPALALGMAVLSIPTLATAATTINVVDEAPLVAKSAGVLVSVEVNCDLSSGPGSMSVSVTLSQRAGNRVTQGSGSQNRNNTINCDGTQTFQVLVTSFGRIFHQGSAIAQVSTFLCDQFICEGEQATEVIRLVR